MAGTLRRRLSGNLLIAAGTLVVLATAVAWYLLPVQYEAYALVKISSSPPAVLASGPAAADEFDIFKRTQTQLMLSHVVLNGALREPEIRGLAMVREHEPSPVSWLKESLTIEFPENAEVMRVAMKGRSADQVKKIVDKVVDVYMQEIVQNDKRMQMANEDKLRRAYESQTAEYEKEFEALRTLESIHKTSGSEAAQTRKRIANEELNLMLARRQDIATRLQEIEMEILVDKARAENPQESRTADPPPAEKPAAGLPMRELEVKREFLQNQYKRTTKELMAKTEEVAALDRFSARVAAKQEALGALRAINTQLRAELDRAKVERLAPERITVVDRAQIDDHRGDAVGRYVTLSVLAVIGLSLAGLGLVVRRPRR